VRVLSSAVEAGGHSSRENRRPRVAAECSGEGVARQRRSLVGWHASAVQWGGSPNGSAPTGMGAMPPRLPAEPCASMRGSAITFALLSRKGKPAGASIGVQF